MKNDELEQIAVSLAKKIVSETYNNSKHIIFVPEGGGFIYTNKFWDIYVPKKLEKLIFDKFIANYPAYEHKASFVVNKAMNFLGLYCLHDTGLPEPSEYRLNVNNGELHIHPDQEIVLKPHNPFSGHTWCLEVDYDPEAIAPLFEKTLNEIFQACDDPDDVIRHFYEVCGYLISSSRNLPVIGIFQGPGSNGKTKLSQTITKLMGPDSVLCKPMKFMTSDGFFNIGLLGKGLFLDDDLAHGTKLPDGHLKSLSEGKKITARPPHGKDVTFMAKAIPLLLTNHMPKSSDISEGMLRRLHLFKFDTSFLGDKQDPERFTKIWATEMPGILNRFIEGYRRLISRGYFRRPDEMEVHIGEWAIQMNAVATYISEACIIDLDVKIKGTDLYSHFRDWCKKNGYPKVFTINEFYGQLEDIGFKKTKPHNAVTFHGLGFKNYQEGT